MAVPVYVVSGPRGGAVPIAIVASQSATEVIIEGRLREGVQPVYIAGLREPGVVLVRIVRGGQITGTSLP